MEWTKNSERNARIKELLAAGESISHIAKLLGISKSIVHYYKPNGHNHSAVVSQRTSDNSVTGTIANKKKWDRKRRSVIDQAITDWDSIKNDPKTMAVLGLYWGEGLRKGFSVGIANNDSGIIKAFIDWIKLRTNSVIEVVVRYYPEHDEQECLAYWGNILKLPIKTRRKAWLGKKRKQHSEHGICYIRCSDWKLKLTILAWIDCWRQEITGEKSKLDAIRSIANQW